MKKPKDLNDGFQHSSMYKYDIESTIKLDGMMDYKSINSMYELYKNLNMNMYVHKTDSQINLFEVEARDNIAKGLKPYTLGKYGELNLIAEPDPEKLIAIYVAKKLMNPTPVIRWQYPVMVKLATPHMISRIEQILHYIKAKADLYQAMEDLEHEHKRFLELNEKTIESVLERGHNLMI
jgi:hypothetical protein